MFKDACFRSWSWRLVCLAGLPAFALQCGCGGKEDGPVTAASSNFQVAEDDAAEAATPAASSTSATPAPSATADLAGDIAIPSAAASGRSPATPDTPATAPGGTEVPAPPPTPPIDMPPAAPATTSYPVPDTAEALMKFLEEMQTRQPQGTTQEEMLADYQRIHMARLEAADKLLGLTPEPKNRVTATQAKLDAMRALVRLGDRQREKDLNAYCRTLLGDKDKDIALLGRLMLFGLAIDALGEGQVQDVQPIVTELKSLIADHPNAPGVFMVTRQAAMLLQAIGRSKEAADAFRTIGNAYKDSTDPKLADQARKLLHEIELDGALRAMMSGQPNGAQSVVDVFTAMAQGGTADAYLLNVAAQIGPVLEVSENYAHAEQLATLVENAFKNSEDKELAAQAAERAKNCRLRTALVGQPFVVEGVKVDGSPFDWNAYQGKVVLVDFWATWCGPCLAEIPNIARSYQTYRDRGFEVVGVNLDDDLPTVKKFLEFQPLPWTTVVSADDATRGFKNALAVKCGVDAIPFIVLVDKEGKVNALHVRGEKLEQKLAQLLGPATPAPAAPATPAPPAKPATQSRAKSADVFRFVSFADVAPASEAAAASEVNPYLPDAALTPAELVQFIQTMRDKPPAIQSRAGFGDAIIAAADRILAAETAEQPRTIAAQAKFDVLHKRACRGDEQAEAGLQDFVAQMRDAREPAIATDAQFFLLEKKVRDADQLALDRVPELLKEMNDYFAGAELTARHLRMASATVHAINRLEDLSERERHFQQFGNLFAKSPCKDLSRYGKKLAKQRGSAPLQELLTKSAESPQA